MSTDQPLPPRTVAQVASTTPGGVSQNEASALIGTVTCANVPLQNVKIKVEPEENIQKNDTCRKFIWGICDKQSQCKFLHKLDIEEMKKVLKFCHDHQNKGGCIREGCTYLHITKEEENLFYTRNVIPKVLVERHEAMAKGMVPSKENKVKPGCPGESFVLPPPPPPPPPLPASGQAHVSVPTPTTAATTVTPPAPAPTLTSNIRPAAVAPTFLAPQQPRAFAGATHSVRPSFSNNTPRIAAAPQVALRCDITRPPPPIPQQVQNGHPAVNVTTSNSRDIFTNGAKRKWPFEAGASKRKSPVGSQTTAELCDDCIQREIRIGQYNKELEKMLCVEADQNLMYQKKLNEFKSGKNILISAVGPENLRMIEEYIEGKPDLSNNLLSHFLQPQQSIQSGFSSNSGSFTLQAFLQLLERIVESNKSSNHILDPIGQINQGSRANIADDVPPALKQTLNNFSRRFSVNQSPQQDQSQFLCEIIQHCQQMLSGENGANGLDILNTVASRQNLNVPPANGSINNIANNFTSNAFENTAMTANRSQSNVVLGQYGGNGIINYGVNANGTSGLPNNAIAPNQQMPLQQVYNQTASTGYNVNAMIPSAAPIGYYGQSYGQPQGQYGGNGIINYGVNANGTSGLPNNAIAPNQQMPLQQVYNQTASTGYNVNAMIPSAAPIGYYGQSYGQPQGMPAVGYQPMTGYQYPAVGAVAPAPVPAPVQAQAAAVQVRVPGTAPAHSMSGPTPAFPHYQPRPHPQPPNYYQTYQ